MLSCNEILNLKEDAIISYFEETFIDEFLEPILVKFPDYYNLRGQEFHLISNREKNEAFEILKTELKI